MAAKNFYDAVVVGLELTSLIAGALLAKRGFRVLLVGQGQPWPSYTIEGVPGVRFPRAPFVLTGHESPALRRVFSELALRPLVQRKTRALSPAFQAVLPRHRIDLGRDPALLARELGRELPDVERAFSTLLSEARAGDAGMDALTAADLTWPASGFFERRALTRALEESPLGRDPAKAAAEGLLPIDHPLARVLSAALSLVLDSPDDGQAATFAADARRQRLLGALLTGAELGEGGLSELYELLLESIRTHNGSVRLNERIDTVTVTRGTVTHVRTLPSDETIGCQFLLWGLPVARLAPLVGDDETAPLFARLFEGVGEPRALLHRYTLNLLLDARAIPEGMGRQVIVMGDAPLWLEAASVADGSRARMTVATQLAARSDDERARVVATLREQLLDNLRTLSPFLRQHLLLIDSPHDGRPPHDVTTGEDRTPGDARRGPETMDSVYAFARTRIHDTTGLSVHTPIKRLLLCNRQVVNGLGMEGTFLTAWSAARVVTRALGRAFMNRGRWTKVEL